MLNRNKTILVICFILSVILFASCSNEQFNLEEGESAPTKQEQIPSEDVSDDESVIDSLSFGVYAFDTLNPLETKNKVLANYLSVVFDSLVTFDKNCAPELCLADSIETADGGLTWQIKIKDNIYFHDGTAFTVYDVKNTLDWLSKNDSIYSYCAKGVNGFEVKSQSELVVRLSQPDALFVSRMTFPVLKSEDLAEGFSVPNGTGMYKFLEQKQDVFSFTVNDKYFREIPPYKEIYINCFADAAALNDSNVDVFINYADNAIKYAKKEDYSIKQFADNVITVLLPSSNVSRQVRHYVNTILDKELIIKATMADCAIVRNSLLLEGTYFSNGYSHETFEAEILKPELLKFIVNRNDEDLLRMAALVQKQIEKDNVNCEVLILDEAAFYDSLKLGDYDFAFYNYKMNPIPDFEAYFFTEGNMNLNNFSDASVDGLILSVKNAYAECDISQAYDLDSLLSYINNQIVKLGTRLSETLPVICICQKMGSVVISDKITDFSLYNFTFWNTMSNILWRV